MTRTAPTTRPGVTVHAFVVPLPIGALAASVGFDVMSRIRAVPCSDYAHPAFMLLVVGIAGGIVAGAFGMRELVATTPGSDAHRRGMRHVVATDVALGLFAISALMRRGSDWCVPVDALPIVVSALGALVLLAGTVGGLRLAHRDRSEPDEPAGP